MSKVDGAYDCMSQTPMGDQASVFSVVSDGVSFNGTNAGPLGSDEASWAQNRSAVTVTND